MNVRVSVLTLYGALLSAQAPLPEVQLLLRQPGGGSTSATGSHTPQDTALSWRQRDGPSSPSQRSAHTSPPASRTPVEEAEGGRTGPPWLLQLCMSLVTQPREDQIGRAHV